MVEYINQFAYPAKRSSTWLWRVLLVSFEIVGGGAL
jgi:hypothetical protein